MGCRPHKHRNHHHQEKEARSRSLSARIQSARQRGSPKNITRPLVLVQVLRSAARRGGEPLVAPPFCVALCNADRLIYHIDNRKKENNYELE